MPHRLKGLKTERGGFQSKDSKPSLEKFVDKRDYVGALTFLNYSSPNEVETLLWKAYCLFHSNDFESAQKIYIDILSGNYKSGDPPEEIGLYLGCVYYFLEMYSEAAEAAIDGPECALKNRLMYHLSLKMEESNEQILMYRQRLMEGEEDQLSRAAMLYTHCNFQEACEIYKRLLTEDRGRVALNLYVAMCYFKLDYYDVSLEALQVYQQSHYDSIFAKNLRACILFRLYDGNAALDEMRDIEDIDRVIKSNDLISHNMVVFTDGQKALQALPPLINSIPEARLNLAIYYLRNNEVEDAHNLLEELEPTTPQEYILKATTKTMKSQYIDEVNVISLEEAKSYFQSVGSSPTETDTIPGRQSMAQFYFLEGQFEDVNVYLSSIQSYMMDDDDFNWNYGLSLVAAEEFENAEEVLLRVNDSDYKTELCYLASLCRSYIMNGKPQDAWDLKSSSTTLAKNDSIFLLQLIANDCYCTRYFSVAVKAFDTLNDIDGNKYVDPLICSCVGAFAELAQQNIRSPFEVEAVTFEIISTLQKYEGNNNIIAMIKEWKRREKNAVRLQS